MGVEKSLGIKLGLITDFAKAASDATKQLGIVADGIERLQNLGATTSVKGLDELEQSINGLTQRIGDSTKRVSDMGNAMSQTASKARQKKTAVDQVSKSVQQMDIASAKATETVLRLGTSMTQFGNAAIVVDKVGTALSGVTAEAVKAKKAVDDLEASLLRLSGAQSRLSLGSGVRDSQGFTQVLPPGIRPMVVPPVYVSLPSQPRYAALPSGNFTWQGYAPSAPAIGSTPRAALPPSYSTGYGPIPQPSQQFDPNVIALPGGTDPYFNARAWWANQRANNPGSAGSGPTMTGFNYGGGGVTPPGGRPPFNWDDAGAFGAGMTRFGNDMQSVGWAGLMNAGLLGGWMFPAVNGSANTEDLFFRNREAILSAGGSASQADNFNNRAMQIAANVGSPFDQTVGGVYDFVSASPENLTAKYGSDPAVQQALMQAYERVAKMQVAGSSSQHQISMEESSLDVNNLIANLGFDTSTPKAYLKAVQDATNILINLKNRTSTQVDLAASSFRAIGPIGKDMDIDPDELVAWVAAMAQGKIRGAPAGQGAKRIFMRQAMPVKKVQELQAYASQMTGGRDTLSLFNTDGTTKSLAKMGEEIVDFEDKNHLNAKQRGGLEGELAGLYALPQMGLFLKSIRSFKNDPKGAAHGFDEYGKSFRTGKVNGIDATEGSYKARTDGNTRNAMDKTYNDILKERQKIFKDMEPEILAVLKDVDGLVSWFDKLPTPLKTAAINFLAFSAGASAITGIFGILGGNALKLLGTFISLGVGAARMAIVVSTGQKLATLAPIANGAALAIRGLGLALMANPIGLIIGGIALAITLLAVAWTHNWGDIQGKTHTVVSWLEDRLKQAIGAVKSFIQGAGDWFKKFGPEVLDGLTLAFPMLAMFNPRFRQAGLDLIKFIADGIKNGASFVVDEVKNIGQRLWDGVKSWASAGAGAVSNFVQGIKDHTGDAVAAAKQMAQRVRDVHPGSEPKDSSSPFANMAKSGKALVTNFTDGITAATPGAVQVASASAQQIRDGIDAIVNGGGGKSKKKKAKASPADVIINLHANQTVAQIQRDAAVIEAALERAGAQIHKKWIDIRQGANITRVYGNAAAYRSAVSDSHASDPMLGAARDYMQNIKRFPHTFEQNIKALSQMLLQSTSAHTRAVIDGMIGTLITQHTKALEAYAKKVATWAGGTDGKGGLMAQFNTEFTKVSTDSQKFGDTKSADDDKLQQAINERKNQELPTLRELERERTIEIDERKQLYSLYTQEVAERDKIINQIQELITRANQLNTTDDKSRQLKAALLQQASSLMDQLGTMSQALAQQGVVIQGVDQKLQQYTNDVDRAANKNKTWADILSNSFAKAGQDAMQSLDTSLSNGMDKLLQRVFSAKKAGIVGFVGSFFADAFSQAFSQIDSKITGAFSQNITSGIGNIFSNLFHLNSTSTASSSSHPVKVQLTDSSGTDIAQDVHDAVVSTSTNTSSLTNVASGISSIATSTQSMSAVATKAQAPTGNSGQGTTGSSADASPISAAIDKAMKSTIGKIVTGLAGAYSGYQLATSPSTMGPTDNIIGGLEAGASTYSMFSGGAASAGGAGPYAAAAVAIYTMLSHHDNPQLMPDKYNGPVIGQGLANFAGSGYNGAAIYNANGNQYQENASLYNQLGGMGEGQYIANYIAQNPSNPANLPQNIIDMFSGQNGSVQYLKNGQVELSNGKIFNWADLTNAAQEATTAIQQFSQQAQNAAIQQAQNAANLAASFTSLILNGPSGFFVPYGETGVGTNSILAPSPTSRTGVAPHRDPNSSGTTSVSKNAAALVSIDLSNMKVDAATLKDLEKMLNNAVPDIVQAVRQADYQDSRLYGNYVSVTS